MIRATGLSHDAEGAADRVSLDYEGRLVRRRRLVTDGGRAVMVDLPRATDLTDHALELEDGTRVAVEAAPEAVLVVTGPLARLAWHVGNRHAPCRIEADRLIVRDDPVMRAMLEGLGATCEAATLPFRPEGGAYGHGRTMGHSH